MADLNSLHRALGNPDLLKSLLTTPPDMTPDLGEDESDIGESPFDDEELLERFERYRKEALDSGSGRDLFERQWQRNILYTLGRQWIEFYPRQGGWKDKRLAQWIPRPVTNKCKECVQAIRAMFTSIKLGINVRPNGSDQANVATAAVADELSPVLHEEHDMDQNMSEFDFWLLVTGNAFLHTFVDYDLKHGVVNVPMEQCMTCGMESKSTDLTGAQPTCPGCQGHEFTPALNPDGSPKQDSQPVGRPVTIPLSPLEIAFNNSYPRFSELPYIIRLRWRPKSYFQNHPQLAPLVDKIAWQRTPSNHSMELFKSLSTHNDLGVSPAYLNEGVRSGDSEEGVPEYEVWEKPSTDYPDGLVFRVYGDKNPVIAHLEDTEALPGPLPYRDAEGKPLFTFAHAGFEHVGGRIWASGPLDVIIQKQDMLNQLDSLILLTMQRMGNPVWLEPKGAEVEKLTGMPGLVIKWNPLTVGGAAKPERIPGEGPHPSMFQIRDQYLRDIEELAGTFDIVKGAKPTGVEAFSALQLLVERSQARFALVFTSRGGAYRNWYKFAIELEREFGPDTRTAAVLTPARSWSFKTFKRAQLQGSVSVIVEDGSNAPKTSLGMRAALEHASTLGMLNMQDPDQRYEGLKLFGLTRLAPSLDINVQSALQKQEAFEQWATPQSVQQTLMTAQQAMMQWQQEVTQGNNFDPNSGEPTIPPPSLLASTPLKWYEWYDAGIHRQEFIKWANGDRIRQIIATVPGADALLEQHLKDIDAAALRRAQQMAGQQAAMTPPPPPSTSSQNINVSGGTGGGPGGAMAGSNRESGKFNQGPQGAQNHGNA